MDAPPPPPADGQGGANIAQSVAAFAGIYLGVIPLIFKLTGATTTELLLTLRLPDPWALVMAIVATVVSAAAFVALSVRRH
ncbi:hypothetical protein [Amycolatopsis suaedae]|uniref:Uncharacterized protein n=1 Tax=Amycolatopsis suaedae TaxID=2510978 RepID=A0A4Q7J255_9PSEU|nr:hypothetical protein [Amycolatopsis suaedae]RZQ61510.1 hypothetical protein EWH70_24405 [Amycolatopsis suaedae]